jgi:hypothetical protein
MAYQQDNTNYGYDTATDYGYGEESTPPAQAPTKMPKRGLNRRGSVTKFSLEEAGKIAGTPEAEMVQQLHAAEMMQNFRNGGAVVTLISP